LVVSRRRVLEAAFILLEFSSPSRRIFIGSHSLPPSLVRCIGLSASASGRRGLGWPRLQALAGKARRGAVHGETAARRARHLAARRRAHRQGQGKKAAQGGGMATALTAGRRCSRRRLRVGGGAASVSMFTVAPRSGPAPPRSRTAPPSSGSSRPCHSAAAMRRRRRGVGLPPPPLFFLYSPLSLP
jgi:hypothetical protein